MPKYKVSWGPDTLDVEADTSQDAWAVFAGQNVLAARQPNLHEQRIELVEAAEVAEAAEPFETDTDVE